MQHLALLVSRHSSCLGVLAILSSACTLKDYNYLGADRDTDAIHGGQGGAVSSAGGSGHGGSIVGGGGVGGAGHGGANDAGAGVSSTLPTTGGGGAVAGGTSS